MTAFFRQLKCTTFFLILAGCFLHSNAIASSPKPKATTSPLVSDTLVVKHNKKDKEIKVPVGTPLKIWFSEKKVHGYLESVTASSVIINNEYGQQEIPKATIEQLKVKTTKTGARVFGALFLGFAAFSGFFTGLSLIIGIIGLITSNLGAVLIVAVPFLFLICLVSYLIGRRLNGRKFKFSKRWSIAQ